MKHIKPYKVYTNDCDEYIDEARRTLVGFERGIKEISFSPQELKQIEDYFIPLSDDGKIEYTADDKIFINYYINKSGDFKVTEQIQVVLKGDITESELKNLVDKLLFDGYLIYYYDLGKGDNHEIYFQILKDNPEARDVIINTIQSIQLNTSCSYLNIKWFKPPQIPETKNSSWV